MNTRLFPFIVSFAISALLAPTSARAAEAVISNPASTSLGVVTGGDAGEGLDLDGNFIYALAIGANPTLSVAVRNATFRGLLTSEVPGANLAAENRILNWYVVDYGDSANDNNLEQATSSIRWSDANNTTLPQDVILTLQNIKVGAQYKVQLMFGEQCCNRGFDVFFNNTLVVKDFNPGVQQGGINDRTAEALITHSFVAAGPTLEIRLDGRPASTDYPDHNAILNAITVEEISAPGDSDGDGLSDAWEQLYFGNLSQTASADPDKDGLTNAEELTAGTNPTLADTDNDGLSDLLEVKTYKTNPGRADTDNDGLSDFDEVTKYKSDPLKSDGDGDLLSDGAEVNQYKTDPSKADTDGDGFSDYNEIHLLTDPVSPNSKPKKTTANLFTGPSPGQGLDFSGTFPYAISFGNDQPGGQIGNALFTADSVDGFTVVSSQVANNWNVDVNYGNSAEQQVLSSVMGSIRWSGSANTPADVIATFSNLKIGASYKMQLLFGERLWARGFNISINGKPVVSEFAPYQWQGGLVGPGNATPRTNGVVVTHSFIATSTDAVVVLDGRPVRDPAMADHNAIINGATLELVSPAADSDNDTLWDAWEMETFGNLAQNANGDPDGDGLTNLQEFTAGTDPNSADSDGDGLKDGDEITIYKTNPSIADTDGDRLSDGDEVKIYKSDPTKTDTDGDTLSDGDEVLTHKTDPIKSNVTTLFAIDDKQVWKYDRSGTDLGTAWKEKSFNDNAWPSGMALIAQEPGATAEPIRTEIERFNDAGDYIVTFYFRTHFNYTGPLGGFLLLRHVVDDGAVFYLNGVEIHRFGLAAGAALNFTTSFAGHENAYEGPFIIPGTNLVSGDNVFAAEVHQSGTGSSDIVFGSELRVSTAPVALPTTAPKFTVFNRAGTNLNLEWTGTGTLESADAVTGPWTAVANAKSPFSAALAGTIKFYRLK